MPKRLNAAISYYLPVKSVQFHKSFMKANEPQHVHLITFVDKYQFEYVGEWITNEQVQNDFIPDGKYHFRVKEAQQFGDVITKIPDSTQVEEKELCPECIKPVTGESYFYALSAAKDLMVAQLNGSLDKVTPENIEDMLGWAHKIDKWMVEKQTERITGEAIF
jgi:hypothetical protein